MSCDRTITGAIKSTGPRGGLCAALLVGLVAGCGGGSPAARYEMAERGVYTATISADGEYSLIGSLNHGASLWRNPDHERLFNWAHRSGETAELVAAAISPDGDRAATTDPRTLVLWDVTSGEALRFWATPGSVLDLDLAPTGRRVLMGLDDHSAILFDAQSGEHVHTLLHEGRVNSVDIADAGGVAITGSDDETAIVWSLESGAEQQRLQHANPVRLVALSADGRFAFTASENQLVAVWDVASGTYAFVLSTRNRGVTAARFSSDGKRLLVGYVNRNVELWDVKSGQVMSRWRTSARNPWHPTGAAVLEVAFTQTPGRYYVVSGDGVRYELRRS